MVLRRMTGYVLLKEIIDNSVDEFIMGNGHKVKLQSKIRVFQFVTMDVVFH